MARLIQPVLWRSQPQAPVRLKPDYYQLVQSARIWSLAPGASQEVANNTLGGFAKTGTIDPASSISGIGVKGDGSTGLYSRAVSVTPQAMWIAVQFVCNTVTTAQKTIFELGSAGTTSSAFIGISSGNGTTSELIAQFRAVDTSTQIINKLALTPVVGSVYTAICVFPSELKAAAYVYVNGVKYTTDFTGSLDLTFTGASTLVHEAVGALKRGTTVLFNSDTVLFTARGLGQIPESLARDISLNPYTLLAPQQRNIYVNVIGGDVSTSVTGVTGTSALGTVSVTAIQNVSTNITGVTGTSALGTVSVTAIQNVSTSVTGVTGTSALGSVTVDVGGSVSTSVTGVTGTSALGTVSVTAIQNISTSVTGVTGTSALGTVSVTIGGSADASVSVTGVTGTTGLGRVLVWGLIDTSQTPNWVRIAT